MQKIYDSTSIAEQFIVLCQKLISYYYYNENLKHVKVHDLLNPLSVNNNKSRLLFSSDENFKKPLWQTEVTQIRLLLLEQSDLGPSCLLLYLNSSVMLGNYLKQMTSEDVIFVMHIFFGLWGFNFIGLHAVDFSDTKVLPSSSKLNVVFF